MIRPRDWKEQAARAPPAKRQKTGSGEVKLTAPEDSPSTGLPDKLGGVSLEVDQAPKVTRQKVNSQPAYGGWGLPTDAEYKPVEQQPPPTDAEYKPLPTDAEYKPVEQQPPPTDAEYKPVEQQPQNSGGWGVPAGQEYEPVQNAPSSGGGWGVPAGQEYEPVQNAPSSGGGWGLPADAAFEPVEQQQEEWGLLSDAQPKTGPQGMNAAADAPSGDSATPALSAETANDDAPGTTSADASSDQESMAKHQGGEQCASDDDSDLSDGAGGVRFKDPRTFDQTTTEPSAEMSEAESSDDGTNPTVREVTHRAVDEHVVSGLISRMVRPLNKVKGQ